MKSEMEIEMEMQLEPIEPTPEELQNWSEIDDLMI